MKLYELAKEVGKTSSEVMNKLKEVGVDIKSANTNLTDEQVDIVRSEYSTMKTIADNANEEKEKNTIVKSDKDYKPEEMIPCRSIYPGVLLFTGDHSGMTYTFNGVGDRRNIEYQDLKAGMLQQKPSMYNPDFIIEDLNLINDEHWSDIKEVYETMYDETELDKVLNLSTPKFREAFEKLPITAKNAIVTIVATQIENGTFESYNKAKIIDEVCGTRFDLKML